jgi:hypothetical protein
MNNIASLRMEPDYVKFHFPAAAVAASYFCVPSNQITLVGLQFPNEQWAFSSLTNK